MQSCWVKTGLALIKPLQIWSGTVRRRRFGDGRFGDVMWNVFSFGMSPKCKTFALPSSGKRVSARVSLALVPDLSNFAVFIAIHDAYHGFGSAIAAYSYANLVKNSSGDKK